MKKQNSAIIITSIIAGVILIVALVALGTLGSFSPYSKNSVTVEGNAEIDVTPDLLTVYFNIETQNETAVGAKDANNIILENLIIQLAIQGFASDELKTQSFNIYPNYEYSNGKQTQDGYIANHYLKIELSSDEFGKISNVIDAGVNAGAGISYINFELSQELQSQYKAEALELASKDAKTKAEAVAEGFDKNLGKLVSVSVNDYNYYPWNIYTRSYDEGESGGSTLQDAEFAKEAIANITPSEQTVSARVSATYKLR